MWMRRGGIVRYVPEYDVQRFKTMGFKEVKKGGKSGKNSENGSNQAKNANTQTDDTGENKPDNSGGDGK